MPSRVVGAVAVLAVGLALAVGADPVKEGAQAYQALVKKYDRAVAVFQKAMQEAETLERVAEEMAVQVDAMGGIERVLLALEPVAVEDRNADLAHAIGPHEDVPAGQEGRRRWPEVGPDQTP